jgi:protein-S-isoprenylcysteine O-methyltransferase Ste14
MTEDTRFHTIFVVIFLVIMVLRLSWHVRAGTWKDKDGVRAGLQREGVFKGLRWLLGPPYGAVLLLYLFRPSSIEGFAIPIWQPLRWFGVGLLVFSVALLGWVHLSLGRNFNTTLVLRRDHELVTSGPYRWVRHPMYSSFIVLFAGMFLVTRNVLLGLLSGLFLLALVKLRTPLEEAQLEERFGPLYEAYRERTGLLWPRLRRSVGNHELTGGLG